MRRQCVSHDDDEDVPTPIKRVRKDAAIPDLPMLPKEIVNEICRLFYDRVDLLSDCLQMSLACVSFRRSLDRLLQENRHEFLMALGKRCMNAFKKCLDFRYVRERQCIDAFEMSYALREKLVCILEKTVHEGDLDLIARTGFVQVKSHSTYSLFKELQYSNEQIYGVANDARITNPILPIVQKALCNVNDFIGLWLNLRLVFRRTCYEIIQQPYKGLSYNTEILFVATRTKMFPIDGTRELSFIYQ